MKNFTSVLNEEEPGVVKAPIALWLAAAATFILYMGITLAAASARGRDGAGIAGTLVGACFWPVVITAISSRWNKTQKGKVKVFFISCLILAILPIVTYFAVRGYSA